LTIIHAADENDEEDDDDDESGNSDDDDDEEEEDTTSKSKGKKRKAVPKEKCPVKWRVSGLYSCFGNVIKSKTTTTIIISKPTTILI